MAGLVANNGASQMGNVSPAEIDTMNPSLLSGLVAALNSENMQLKKFIAAEDSDAVQKATKGLGTDEARLVEVLCKRTKAQLDMLTAASVQRTGKTLLQCVNSDVSGSFGKMMAYSLMDIDDYGAKVFTAATKGVGTDLVNTRTNAELAAIKVKWDAQNNGSVIDCLNKEFGTFSKYIKKILIAQFSGVKSESTAVDRAAAVEQARLLYKAGVGRMGTDEDVFIEILTKQSRAQIQAIKQEYEKAQNMSLKKAIEQETSGHFEKALIALLAPSITAYTAQALHESFDGVGVDKDRVCRILGGTDKKAMPAVCAAYLDIFGQTLQESLKKETLVTGDFLAATIAWCDCKDPTNGLEYITPPTEPRALAKHLLAERMNLRTHIATNDAQLIKKACKGLGTDEDAVIAVICSRTKEHLKLVDRKYHELYGKSLIQEIKSETSGYFEDLLVGLVSPYDDFDATIIKKACDGLGSNEQALIECLAPRSNARIAAMKAKYDARNSRPLIDRLNSELSGDMKKLIITLLSGERNEAAPANVQLATAHARHLHEAGVARMGTDEAVFIEILAKSSRAHIEAIKKEYERQFGHSLHRAIEKETSGDMEDALLALVRTPTEYYARRLKKAFAGLGTNDEGVVRILGSHDKNEIKLIAEHYLEVYGQTLSEALKSELSGNYKKAAMAWVTVPDPMNLSSLHAALAAVAPPTLARQAAPQQTQRPVQQVQQPAAVAPPQQQLNVSQTRQLYAGDMSTLPQANAALDVLRVGLGWDTRGKAIDLDAGVVMCGAQGNVINTVYFACKDAPGIRAGGDNRTGDGAGDDEVIDIRLSAIQSNVHTLVFTVHCFTGGASFADVNNAYVRLVVPNTGHVCAVFKLDGNAVRSQGVAFAMLQRCQGGWVYCAVGSPLSGNNAVHYETAQAVQHLVQTTSVRTARIVC